MSDAKPQTSDDFNTWADDPDGPVALCLKQKLIPVEGDDAVIFPPTYAHGDDKSPYNIDTLSDGTNVVTIDSVGSQANRIEPIFMVPPYDKLVPQIKITYGKNHEKSVSLLEAGHRLGDAIVRCTGLRDEASDAFVAFLNGDASCIAEMAPTSLVFGVWDSRGGTQAKLPRLIQSVIRARDVEPLKRSATYVPAIDYSDESAGLFTKVNREETKEEAKERKAFEGKLSERGFLHNPATGKHGGVLVHGNSRIERTVTVNLVALRRLDAKVKDNEKKFVKDVNKTRDLRRYILGLTLIAAAAPMELFLRSGCLLTPDPDAPAEWDLVARDGRRAGVILDKTVVHEYAKAARNMFEIKTFSEPFEYKRDSAKQDVNKKEAKIKAKSDA